MRKRLALNTASNVFTLFLKLGITFIMTPIFIKNMGNHDYGIWEMIGAVIGYMGILDMGIRPATSRFASGFIAKNDETSLRSLYATTWYFLLAVGLLIALSLTFWALFFPELLSSKGATDSTKYTWFLLIIAVQLLITFPSYTAESYLEAYQEYYLKNNITIVNSIIGSAILFVYINPDNALVLLALCNAIGGSIKYLFLIWVLQYRRPFLSLRRAYFSLVQLKELLRFSIKTVVQGIASRIESATDSLVIGLIMGPASVPLYSVPANLVGYVRMISWNFTHVFMPYFSALNAVEDQKQIQKVYLMGSKLTIAPTLILSIGIVLLGADFLGIWVGAEIANSAESFLWVMVGFISLPLLNPMSNRYLTAIDKHIFFAKWQPLFALMNLALSLLLIDPLGIFGVALGSLIPGLIFQPILLAFCCKYLGISTWYYLRVSLLPWLLPCIFMAASILYLRSLFVIDSYFLLLSIAAAGTAIFIFGSLLFALSRQERTELMNMLRRN
jgi:O-antigen/teichoic acid export membrane protein